MLGQPKDRNVYVVDDEASIRHLLRDILTDLQFTPRPFATGQDFLDSVDDLPPGCVILDFKMPDVDGLEVLRSMSKHIGRMPVIMLSGHGDVTNAVLAMQLGASAFLQKPFVTGDLEVTLDQAFTTLETALPMLERRQSARDLVSGLTDREREVLQGLLAGMANKELAALLNLSPRTVEMHRAHMMEHLQAHTLADVLRIGFDAEITPLPLTN